MTGEVVVVAPTPVMTRAVELVLVGSEGVSVTAQAGVLASDGRTVRTERRTAYEHHIVLNRHVTLLGASMLSPPLYGRARLIT